MSGRKVTIVYNANHPRGIVGLNVCSVSCGARAWKGTNGVQRDKTPSKAFRSRYNGVVTECRISSLNKKCEKQA